MPRMDLRLAGLLFSLVLAGLALPVARAQASALHFPATGHNLTDEHGLLGFWQAHDGARLLGAPVSEAFEANGQIVQYFERGRLELVQPAGSETPQVATGRVGSEYAEALWRSFPDAPPRAKAADELVFETTGHTLRAPFLGFWQAAGGAEFFGAPISEPLWEQVERGRRQVQYFERGRLERDPAALGTTDEVVVGNLGRALALLYGYDLAPVANPGYEVSGPPPAALIDEGPLVAPTATPLPPPPPPPAPAQPAAQPPAAAAPNVGGKLVVVDLSQQWLYAYEDGEQVFDAPVTTGRDGMQTPTGKYAIYAKLKVQTMSGTDNGVPWVVPNVPHVMYINGGVALHGTYWHKLFGSGVRVSHGCINLPLRSAAWLYSWAPVGTPVTVTY